MDYMGSFDIFDNSKMETYPLKERENRNLIEGFMEVNLKSDHHVLEFRSSRDVIRDYDI